MIKNIKVIHKNIIIKIIIIILFLILKKKNIKNIIYLFIYIWKATFSVLHVFESRIIPQI